MPGHGFNIGVFRSEFHSKDVLRNNQFLVQMQIPLGLFEMTNWARNIDAVQTMEYWIQGTSLPAFALSTHGVARYGYGPFEKRPFQPLFPDVNLHVIDDGTGAIFKFFNQWMNIIDCSDLRNGPGAAAVAVAAGGLAPAAIDMYPYEIGYKQEYQTDIRIIVYNQIGDAVKWINLREAWPIALGDIRVDWADNNSYQVLPVSIAFTDWYSIEPGTVGAGEP